MAWDQQQGYYQDPYQQYGQDGYDPGYGYDYGYQEPQEDTESEKLRKDELEKERMEALESNRLYLKKMKKHCVKEDFTDLERQQLFLFEVLVENMEVNSDSVLGLVTEKDQQAYISARVQFLNSPWMEICERDMMLEGSYQEKGEDTEYFQALGEGGGYAYTESYKDARLQGGVGQATPRTSQEEGSKKSQPVEGEGVEEEVTFTTKWENSSGKSCLSSESAMMIIRDLTKYPVILQALRCVVSKDGKEVCEPIGYAQVRLPEDFALSVIQSTKPSVILPVSSVHRETLDLRNVFGVKEGRVDMFLRLSCFGPAIITSFQSSGQDRKYVFKPSPLDSNFITPAETTPPSRSDVLKPIITEEEKTVGITIQKEYDFFQKPVLWKRSDDFNNCGCKGGKEESDDERVSRPSSLGSLRLPLTSDISLCKYVIPPSVFRKLKFEDPTCDWHSLVSSGIKNSPGGNCGCLDPPQKNSEGKPGGETGGRSSPAPSGPPPLGEEHRKYSSDPINATKVSRVYKMMLPHDRKPLTKDMGLKKEPTDCGCDCPFIKDALDSKKLFLI